jgi:hypothetical protein
LWFLGENDRDDEAIYIRVPPQVILKPGEEGTVVVRVGATLLDAPGNVTMGVMAVESPRSVR